MSPPLGDAAPSIVVRRFERLDQDRFETVVQQGMRDRWGDAFDASYNADVADVWATYVEHGADVVVLEDAGTVVATGVLVDLGDGVGRLLRMSVDRDHRRRGHASAVVAHLLDCARDRDMDRVVVLTDTPWPDAVAFYRSCGFAIEAVDDVDTWLGLALAPRP